MRKCPVGHTCPSIDNALQSLFTVKESVKISLKFLEDFDNLEFPDELKDHLSNINRELREALKYAELEDELEELREQNAKLREWGEGLVDDLGEEERDFRDQINTLEKENRINVENLADRIDVLNDQVSNLGEELRDKQDLINELETTIREQQVQISELSSDLKYYEEDEC